MLLTLLIAQASAVDAERAFAAAAQRDGQWSALHKYAAPDATMFVPQPVKAQEWLMGGGVHVTNDTLAYSYHVETTFNRDVEIALWTGKTWERVVFDRVPPPE